MTFGCHCHIRRPATRTLVGLSSDWARAGVGFSMVKVRLCHRTLASTLVVGLTSKPTPPPKPSTLRWKLSGGVPSPSYLVSPEPGMSVPVNSTPPNERFRRRPKLLVPNFLAHMRSNDSKLLVLGSVPTPNPAWSCALP